MPKKHLLLYYNFEHIHTACPVAIDLNSTTIPIIRAILNIVGNSTQALLELLQRILGPDVISVNSTTICLLRNISAILTGILGGTLGDSLGDVLGGLLG